MADDVGQGSAAPGWYEDPMARHQHRYWDGATWTGDVADAGVASVDPLDGSGAEASTGAADGERVLLVLPMSTDVLWGGYLTLHVTDRRLVVEKVMGSGAGAGAMLAAGLAGAAIATDLARERTNQALSQYRAPDEILRASAGNYAIDYAAVTAVRLKRKALPIGYSRCKIESSQKNVHLAFKRESFDEAAQVIRQMLGDKVEVK